MQKLHLNQSEHGETVMSRQIHQETEQSAPQSNLEKQAAATLPLAKAQNSAGGDSFYPY